MMMMYVMHHAFRRDLDEFAAALPGTPRPRTGRPGSCWPTRWEIFAEILHQHHSGEDAGLWPALLEHGPTRTGRALEAMEAEHAEIDPLLEACGAGFARLARARRRGRPGRLAVRLAATRDSLARHLAHEETDAIAILQRLMTQEQWHALDEEHFKEKNSLRFIAAVVPWAAYGVPREARDRVLAQTGFGFKLVWLATRKRFAAREARTFQYAE